MAGLIGQGRKKREFANRAQQKSLELKNKIAKTKAELEARRDAENDATKGELLGMAAQPAMDYAGAEGAAVLTGTSGPGLSSVESWKMGLDRDYAIPKGGLAESATGDVGLAPKDFNSSYQSAGVGEGQVGRAPTDFNAANVQGMTGPEPTVTIGVEDEVVNVVPGADSAAVNTVPGVDSTVTSSGAVPPPATGAENLASVIGDQGSSKLASTGGAEAAKQLTAETAKQGVNATGTAVGTGASAAVGLAGAAGGYGAGALADELGASEPVKAVSQVAGGALAGAAMGSVVPGVGTAVGAAIGGIGQLLGVGIGMA
jgi:hypothetical protein